LAFDYDGTLAPIVADRDLAKMRAKTAQLLCKVCQLYPCAVISGRSKADVGLRLGNASVKYVIGNHGLEPGRDLSEFASEIASVRPSLELALSRCRGVELEDKVYSLAVHYRKSRQKRQARATIRAAVLALPLAMRIVTGKLVVNVVPERAANKGDALLDLRTRAAANTAFYIGDDVTDEDVFTLDQPGRLFTVRVGRSKASAAKYFLRDQREMDTLLAKLVELRAKNQQP
ncbi:MAG TPA: trehalose-phosphatase, partial [Polyangiaceae bacterium]|nr:trehalose-phosphatase [Polyangiaceae bacterium]